MTRAPILHPTLPVRAVALLAVAAAALVGDPATAAEIDGRIYLSGGPVTTDGESSDQLEQQYSFTLFQRFTPYLALRLGHRYFDVSSEGASEFGFRTQEPNVQLLYNRPRLQASVSFHDRTTDTAQSADSFELRSLIGGLTWRPSRGPSYSLRFREEENVAEIATFGRGADSRLVSFSTFYDRSFWGLGYTLESYELENEASNLRFDQLRHELRGQASRRFLDGRFSLAFDSLVSYLDRSSEVPEGADLAEPVPALQGLLAIDPSPETGELAAAPALADGEFATGVPAAEIGGANTFRNVGVDLGFTRPVTRFEVTVDAPSSPAVVWQVFHSADNLLWEPVGAVTRQYDPGLLRYTLRFPEVTDRFFKAVNVTVNPEIGVRVAEVRALVDQEGVAQRTSGETTRYRADLIAGFQPTERVSGQVSVGASTDENLAGTLVLRDYEEMHGAARLQVELPRDLRLGVGYQYLDFESRFGQVLARTENRYDASLAWIPRETLDAVLSVTVRDELEEGDLLRSTESLRLRVTADLLPDLQLISEVEAARVDDPVLGLDRTSDTWRQTLEARPRQNWTVSGGYSFTRYETTGERGVDLDRGELHLRSTWAPTSYLLLDGTWGWVEFNDERSLRQSYSLAYSPGTRLTLSASFQDYDDEALRSTSSTTATANYRFNPRLSLFGNYTASRFDVFGGQTSDTETFRLGLALFF